MLIVIFCVVIITATVVPSLTQTVYTLAQHIPEHIDLNKIKNEVNANWFLRCNEFISIQKCCLKDGNLPLSPISFKRRSQKLNKFTSFTFGV